MYEKLLVLFEIPREWTHLEWSKKCWSWKKSTAATTKFSMKIWVNEWQIELQIVALIIFFCSLEYSDPRLENLPFTGSPVPVLIILTLYLLFVSGRGQKWMKNRKPFELTRIMNCYNIFQVVANAYVFYMVWQTELRRKLMINGISLFPGNHWTFQSRQLQFFLRPGT